MKQQKLNEQRDYVQQPRSAVERKTEFDRIRDGIETGPGRTVQSEKDSCDVNQIMKRYRQTNQLPMETRRALYGDFSDMGSYQEALDIVAHAQAQFHSLPSDVRDRFGNDPAKFLNAVETADKNKDTFDYLAKVGVFEVRKESDSDVLRDMRDTLKKSQKSDSGVSKTKGDT